MKDIKVEVIAPWWTNPYIVFCHVFANFHGCEVDKEKMASFIVKHIKVKAVIL